MLLLLGLLAGCGGTDGTGPAPPPQNHAPLAVGSIPTPGLHVSDTLTLDVSQAFRDPDGDALTYSIATSDARTVQATITAGHATIVALAVGSADITVTATDPGGLSARQTFGVTVSMPPPAPPVPAQVEILASDLPPDHAHLGDGWVSVDTTVAWSCSGHCTWLRGRVVDQYGEEMAARPVLAFGDSAEVEYGWAWRGERGSAVAALVQEDDGVYRIDYPRRSWDPHFLPVVASHDDLADTLVHVAAGRLERVDERSACPGVPRTCPPWGLTLGVGEVLEVPTDGWFTEPRVGYSFPPDIYSEDRPSEIRSVSWSDGVLRVTGLTSGVAGFEYSARTPEYRSEDGRIVVAVDYCHEPETVYPRAPASAKFRIELRFDGDWSECARRVIGYAAGFFEAALASNDQPPFVVDVGYGCPGWACGGATGGVVDRPGGGFYFNGGRIAWQLTDLFKPVFGAVPDEDDYRTALHELAHVFGIGTYWHSGRNGAPTLVNPAHDAVVDTHFPGPHAVAAFEAAGGSSYEGGKVPVMNDPSVHGVNGHWRDVVCGELMSYCRRSRVGIISSAVSAITLGALADLGWLVDMSVAEPYSLPSADMAAMWAEDAPWHLGDDVMPPGSRR